MKNNIWNRTKVIGVLSILTVLALVTACGAVKDKIAEMGNSIDVKGHWLMTESEKSNLVEKAIEKESMVLTFQDGKAAFAPTDSVKGLAVFTLLSGCTAGPRPYHMEKDQIVFDAVAGCEERRITVQVLDATTFKFPDPEINELVRTFHRIDESTYQSLVKVADRK